jgi:hypothetical protein
VYIGGGVLLLIIVSVGDHLAAVSESGIYGGLWKNFVLK